MDGLTLLLVFVGILLLLTFIKVNVFWGKYGKVLKVFGIFFGFGRWESRQLVIAFLVR